MAKPKTFTFGVEDLVSVVGYEGDGVVRVLRVKTFDDAHVTGIDLLRSSPTEPIYRTYRLDKVDRLAPVVGQQEG
jgi:hypothetical protein